MEPATPASVWKARLEPSENGDNRQHIVYKLASDTASQQCPDTTNGMIIWLWNRYCGSQMDYVKLNKPECEKLVIFQPAIYLSVNFFRAVTSTNQDEQYLWNKVRTSLAKPTTQEQKANLGKMPDDYQTFIKQYQDPTQRRKNYLVGGYWIPGRYANGTVECFELGHLVHAFVQPSFWYDIFRKSTKTFVGKSIGAAMRSTNLPDMVLVIQPYNRNFSGQKVAGIGWEEVKDEFRKLYDGNSEIHTKYLFDFPDHNIDDYRRLSVNPFYHYETWISPAMLAIFFPQDQPKPAPQAYAALEELQRKVWWQGKDDPGYDNVSPESEAGQIPLSSGRILAATMAKRPRTQEQVMGISAPELATNYFGWTKTGKLDSFSVAEWLHISAFSFGGISDEAGATELWNSSQSQFNLILGTSETNSVMLRYEKAWQELFIYEQMLRDAIRAKDANASGCGEATGFLVYQNNNHLDVDIETITRLNGQWTAETVRFELNAWWRRVTAKCPWISFGLQYDISLQGVSKLLGVENMRFDTVFYPFGRPFFTKGEAMVDVRLLYGLLQRRLEEVGKVVVQGSGDLEEEPPSEPTGGDLQEEPATGAGIIFEAEIMSAQTFRSVSNKTVIRRLTLAEEVETRLEDYAHISSEVASQVPDDAVMIEEATRDQIGDSAEATDAVLEERHTTNPPPDSTVMAALEAELTSMDAFERLESIDSFVDNLAAFLDFRDTLEESSRPSVAMQNLDSSDSLKCETTLSMEESGPASYHEAAPPMFESTTTNSMVSDWSRENVVEAGGIRLQNVALVISTGENSFANLPVSVRAVAGEPTEEGLLLAPASAVNGAGITQPPPPPVLLLSASEQSGLSISGPLLSSATAINNTAARKLRDNVRTATLPEYVLRGDVYNLFGIRGLTGKLYTYQSTDPNVAVRESVKPDLQLYASKVGKSPFAALFPSVSFSSGVANNLPISNIELIYSEDKNDIFHLPGLRIEADVEFEGALQPIANVLDMIFPDTSKPPSHLHVAAHLSPDRNWTQMPAFTCFTLQGSFEDMVLPVGDWLTFVKVGIQVSATQMAVPRGQERWALGYGLFGELDIHDFPGIPLPLRVKYRLSKIGKMYQIAMRVAADGGWKGMLGFERLTMTSVQLNTSFSTKSFGDSFAIQVSGFMVLGTMDIYLSGSFSKNETSLEAEVGKFTWDDVVTAYRQITGGSLQEDLKGNDFTFESLWIKISNKGVSLAGTISFNDHTSASGIISFDEFGLAISGSISDFQVDGTDIVIKEASLDIFVGAATKGGRVNQFSVKGMVDFENQRLAVGLHTSSDGFGPRRWMVYGAFDGDLRISRLAPELAGTDLDVSLKKAALIASNYDSKHDNSGSGLNVLNYPVSTGIQFFALIDPLPALNSVTGNKKVDGLMVAAAIDPKDKKLGLTIHLPASMSIEFGKATTLRNFEVAIEISKAPELMLKGVLEIKMEKQSPLKFDLALAAGPTHAKAYIETAAVWRNPFGISDKVEIRCMALDIQIDYATVAVSGPSKLAIAGGGVASNITGNADISVSQLPDQQLLSLNISRINVAEFIRFTGDVINSTTLKEIGNKDFLVFTNASMYFSTGATIGTKLYPAGISAGGSMTIFGKTASFEAAVGSSGISFLGAVDPFTIGPLEVRSASSNSHDPRARLEIVMTTHEQRILIDGMITFLGLEVKMLVRASMQPVALNAVISIRFGEMLSFEMIAVAGNISNYKDLSQANLLFTATLDTTLVNDIAKGVIALLNHLQDAASGAIDSLIFSLTESLRQAEGELERCNKKLAEGRINVEAARKVRNDIVANEEAKRAEANAEIARLEKIVQDRTDEKDEAVKQAKEELARLKREEEAEITQRRAEYQTKLNNAEAEQRQHQQTKRELEEKKRIKFGDLWNQLLEKRRHLDRMKGNIPHLEWQKNDKKRRLDEGNYFQKAGRGIEYLAAVSALEGSRAAIWGIENSVEQLDKKLRSTGWLNLELDLQNVEGLLEQVQKNPILRGLTVDDFLRDTVRAHNDRVKAAQQVVDDAMAANSRYMDAIKQAQKELEDRRPGLKDRMARADEAIKRAQEDKELQRLQGEADLAAVEVEGLKRQVEGLGKALADLKAGIRGTTEDLTKLIGKVQKRLFCVRSVKVEIYAREIVQGRGLKFTVAGDGEGAARKEFTVEWSPVQSVSDLYWAIIDKAL